MNHVLAIYPSLVGAAQNEHTNVPVGKLLVRCRKELHRLKGRPSDLELVEIFLSKAEATIDSTVASFGASSPWSTMYL